MAQRGWLGPRDAWPHHPDLDDVLADARGHGWWLRSLADRFIWGRITCAQPLGNETLRQDCCVVVILRSASSRPHQDSRVRRSIATCPHEELQRLDEGSTISSKPSPYDRPGAGQDMGRRG